MQTRMKDGDPGSSMARSPLPRWTSASYSESDGTVNSLALRKAKKPRQHAAHIIFVSAAPADPDHTNFNFINMSGVTGSRCFVSRGCRSASSRLMPRSIRTLTVPFYYSGTDCAGPA